MRLVGYLRVSSEAQLDGLGLDVQARAVRRWARQHGHRIVEVCQEPAEQASLARIRELHGPGRSLRQIGAALEVEGHRPREGDRWHPNTLARILERLDAS